MKQWACPRDAFTQQRQQRSGDGMQMQERAQGERAVVGRRVRTTVWGRAEERDQVAAEGARERRGASARAGELSAWPSRGSVGPPTEVSVIARVVTRAPPPPPTNWVGWVDGRESESRSRICGLFWSPFGCGVQIHMNFFGRSDFFRFQPKRRKFEKFRNFGSEIANPELRLLFDQIESIIKEREARLRERREAEGLGRGRAGRRQAV